MNNGVLTFAPTSKPEMPITIAMSSELLFDQQMTPGPAFSFVKALKAVNATITECYPETEELFKVILIREKLSHELDNIIKTYGLRDLIICCLERGKNLIADLKGNKTHLYLSAEPGFKIQEAVNAGIAAAVVVPQKVSEVQELKECQLRVVVDGDGVLFSDESERVNQKGLAQFLMHERQNVNNPMNEGPFKDFLKALGNMQKKLYAKRGPTDCTICTYLVTSRDAGCPGYRALNTLKTWGLEINQAYFLKGASKGPLLKMISPHIFFDDQMKHVDDAKEKGILACCVPHWTKTVVYTVAGAAGAVVLAPVALGAAGFTSAGIAAGSIAAKMMSATAIANGGAVAAGSLVAVLQSAGAAGLSGAATAAVAGVGGAVGWLTSVIGRKS